MFVKFLTDRTVLDHLGGVDQSFHAGQVVELSDASAQRWIRRAVAVEVHGTGSTSSSPEHVISAKTSTPNDERRSRSNKQKPQPDLLDGSDTLER